MEGEHAGRGEGLELGAAPTKTAPPPKMHQPVWVPGDLPSHLRRAIPGVCLLTWGGCNISSP